MDCDDDNIEDENDGEDNNDDEDEFAFNDEALANIDIDTNIQTATTTEKSTPVTSKPQTDPSQRRQTKSFTKNKQKQVFTGLGYGAERLNGCDLSDMIPQEISNNSSKKNSAFVKKVERLTFYIRPRLHVHDNRHAPTLIKSFIRALRQIDPTLILLPFDDSDTSLNSVIHTEDTIPDDEADMSKWITKIRYNVHQKLCFSARISITMPIKDFKSNVFPWCKEHKHWITFDEIEAEETFTPGWICGLHNKNVNIDDLKSWICAQDGGDEFVNLIKIYPRKIWQTVPNTTEKRMYDVFAIGGSAAKSDAILTFLYSIKWNGIYDTATFIPMKINEIFTVAHMIQAIDKQNAHRNSEFCKSIVVQNNETIYSMSDGKQVTFLDWALQCEVRGERIFRNVFANKGNYVKLVYSKESNKLLETVN